MNLRSWSKSDDAVGAQSPPGSSAVLSELSTLYRAHLRDSQKCPRISPTVPLTMTQETIFKAVDRILLNAVHF
jgi:hypothetical protein